MSTRISALPYGENCPVIIAFVDVQPVLITELLPDKGNAVLSAGVCEGVGFDGIVDSSRSQRIGDFVEKLGIIGRDELPAVKKAYHNDIPR